MEFPTELQVRETSRANEANEANVPILRFSSSVSSDSKAQEAFRLSESPDSNSRNIFDEGTFAFSGALYLDLLDIKLNDQVDTRYDRHLKVLSLEHCSNKIIKAASLFNTGLSKSCESDLISAKKCFSEALDQLHDFNPTCLEYIPTVTIRDQVFVTVSLLTCIVLLNLGHLEFQQSNFNESSHFYHQCLDYLKSLRFDLCQKNSNQSDMCQEAIFYSSYMMAACLNCIGITLLKKEVTGEQKGKKQHDLIQAQAKACLEYLKASITLYEECSINDDVLGDSLTTLNANMATAFNNLGRIHYILDDFEQSLESYTVCLNLRLLALPANHLDISVSYFNIGQALQTLDGDVEEVLDHYLTFLAIAAPILGYADESIVNVVKVVSDLHITLGNFVEAECILREHLSGSSFTSNEALKSKVILLTTLSTVFASQQKLEESLDTLVQARDLILTMPEDDFLVRCYITNSVNIAMILTRNGDYVQALVLYQRAIAKITRLDHQQEQFLEVLIDLHMNVASIYEGMEDISNAITHVEKATSLAKKVQGLCHDKVSTYLNRLGLLFYKEYKYESALSCFFECLDIRTQTMSRGTKSQITSALYNIATVYRATGETDRALQVLFKVLDYERQLISESNDEVHPKDHILTLRSIFDVYADQSVATPEKGIEYLLGAMRMCRLHKDTIDSSMGRKVFFSLGDFLTLNKKAAEGFKYYCEGCELFGADTDSNVIAESGGNGQRIMLAQLCTDKNVFPLHAAAA